MKGGRLPSKEKPSFPAFNQAPTSESAIASDDEVGTTWDNEKLATVKSRAFKGHKKGVTAVNYLCNDSKVLSSDQEGDVRLWNLVSGQQEQIHLNRHDDVISSMKLDAHETKYFTTSWDKTLKSWDLTTGTLLWRGCHDGILTNGDVSADSKMFLTVSDMDRRVKIWATSTGQVLQDIKDLHQGTIMSCRWMQSGEKFLTGSMDGQVKVWDMRSCKTTLTLAAHKAAVSCIDSTSDDMIATGSWDKRIALWDVSTGAYRSKGPDILDQAHNGCVASLNFDPTGSLLLSASYDKTLNVWDLTSDCRKLNLKGHTNWVNDAKLSSDLNWVVSGSNDKTVRVWNLQKVEDLPLPLTGGNRRSIGLNVINCRDCGKAFSFASDTEFDQYLQSWLCVICRLQKPSRQPPSGNPISSSNQMLQKYS